MRPALAPERSVPYKDPMGFTESTTTCPSCGEEVVVGNPMCGNCGGDMTSASPAATPLGEPSPKRSIGLSRGVAALTVLILLGTLVTGFVVNLRSNLESGSPVPIAPVEVEATVTEPGVAEEFPRDRSSRQYRGVKELFAALRSNGLKCTRARVQARGPAIQSGSCSVGQDLLIITTYSNVRSFELLLNGLQQGSNSFMHGRNWIIIYTFRGTGKKVRKAIGGTVRENPDAPELPSI